MSPAHTTALFSSSSSSSSPTCRRSSTPLVTLAVPASTPGPPSQTTPCARGRIATTNAILIHMAQAAVSPTPSSTTRRSARGRLPPTTICRTASCRGVLWILITATSPTWRLRSLTNKRIQLSITPTKRAGTWTLIRFSTASLTSSKEGRLECRYERRAK